MTYVLHGRQYVVVATGGDDSEQPDRLVAFGLPRVKTDRVVSIGVKTGTKTH